MPVSWNFALFIATSLPIASSITTQLLIGESYYYPRVKKQLDKPTAFLGWGLKGSGVRAEKLAREYEAECWHLEDGFIRSYMPGARSVGLSLVIDKTGIYYDASRPSDLETLLEKSKDLLNGVSENISDCIARIKKNKISKYNHAPLLDVEWLSSVPQGSVLVIDQTYGDLSVEKGGASDADFYKMVDVALAENPQATVYIKTHPEVSSGQKRGYLSDYPDHPRVEKITWPCNPIHLMEHVEKVYVVTSTMGFEALMLGKPVSVFGMPWYAGWGATIDYQHCARRTQRRSMQELFAAAYIHYTTYLNPVTHKPGSLNDVIDWLVLQKQREAELPKRVIAVGLRKWKAANLAPLLSLHPEKLVFAKSQRRVQQLGVNSDDAVVAWGRDISSELEALINHAGAARWRMEDGFIRSVGLGANLVAPQSLVLDDQGIYFDPSNVSRLESLLTTLTPSGNELRAAQRVRELIVREGITKYNVEPRVTPTWADGEKEVVLVPGQVEDDASIRYGSKTISSNLRLLQAARDMHPQALVVYKPHPDVVYANRAGKIDEAYEYADIVEDACSVISCIEHCDVVHTMTSLVGFDALLRGKKVVTYGEPFYAGWGLTEDQAVHSTALQRRVRALTLDELVVGVLFRYPRYWDPLLRGYTTCEGVIRQIISQRNANESLKSPASHRPGFLKKQWIKRKAIKEARLNAYNI
ncbi:capsular polysaccharide biosynthesis protein [Vreelandella aquamarina]|uniref:capsular polysaccharide biosynthesis protein n=1 Tax=Vreelandella aquamarina TaxID=77097 RepID=UPI0009E32595|nr:capsular polysaccharide biosynthesis protein [Halomonas meridiana]|tara:strand:- start:1852 stop:3945 length:2094 start_codon:yes stop_codon:yes gene_type:complete